MSKSEEIRDKRSQYVKEIIKNSDNSKGFEIRKLSKELFLSERTIQRDYYKKSDTVS